MEWSVRSCLKEVSTSKTETFLNDHPLSNLLRVSENNFSSIIYRRRAKDILNTPILNLVRNGGESKQKEMIT